MCNQKNIFKILSLSIMFFIIQGYNALLLGQCSLITARGSQQMPSSVCAPVNFTMNVGYKFWVPVDTNLVQIHFVWNDGTGATTTVVGMWNGQDSVFADASHVYLPTANVCARTAETYLIYDGDTCTTSGRQEQTFSVWGTDEENGAVIQTDPVIEYVCEGDPVYVVFRDNSIFNCNINIEPDIPNRYFRWVQFIYGTQTNAGDRIPDVTVDDGAGTIYPMTDGTGNSLGTVDGPIIRINIPADGPNQVAWPVIAPPGGQVGDIFELTLRNWNVCNPYDNNPTDGLPPSDPVNGDNAPITTTALVLIIGAPPSVPGTFYQYCANTPINLTAAPPQAGAVINWYSDSLLNNLVHTGNSFDPTQPPYNLDNSVGGNHSLWITAQQNSCESQPVRIDIQILDNPTASNAGNNFAVCADTTTLHGNAPSIGTGQWTTTSGAIITNPNSALTPISNLSTGPNVFYWRITNGPCVSVDSVIVYRDLQPSPAVAGPDIDLCNTNNTILTANTPDNNGIGQWMINLGGGTVTTPSNPNSTFTGINPGNNRLLWIIQSQYGACNTTRDTLVVRRDILPTPANAGPDRSLCDSSGTRLNGNVVFPAGTGTWTTVTGTATVVQPNVNNSQVNNLLFGANRFEWRIASILGICPTSRDTVTITRYQMPSPANAGVNQLLCLSNTATLNANNATAGTGEWFVTNNPSGVNPFFSDINNPSTTMTVNPGNEGLYILAWTISNGNCITSDTVNIDFGIPVIANAGPDDSACGIDYPLNAVLGTIGTGTWSIISGLGSVAFTPDNQDPNALAAITPGNEGMYEFLWSVGSGSCPPSTDTVNIFFKIRPSDPGTSNTASCGPNTFTLTSTIGANGNVNYWYNTSVAPTPIATGTTFTTPLLTTTRSYWVSSYNTISQCESDRVQVLIIINPIPGLPFPIDTVLCGTGTYTLLSAIGANANTNRWYSAQLGGTPLATSQNYTVNITSSTSYWVSSYDSLTGCESNRVELTITLNTSPQNPAVSGAISCGPAFLTLHSTIGSGGDENRWYTTPVGGAVIVTDTIYQNTFLSTTSYWVSTLNTTTGCESQRVQVTATINPVPDIPIANDTGKCGPGIFTLTAAPGNNGNQVRWYSQPTGGLLLNNGNTYTTAFLNATTSYWLTTYNTVTDCESTRDQLQVSIYPMPGLQVISGLTDLSLGQSAIYSVTSNAGSTYNWTIPTQVTVLGNFGYYVILEFPQTGTFNIAVQEISINGCPGPPANKLVIVSNDSLRVNIQVSGSNGCAGVPLSVLADASGGTMPYNYNWTGDITYLSSTNIENPYFSAPATGTYHLYVDVVDNSLDIVSDSITIEVYPNPTAQIMNTDTIVCVGESVQLDVQYTGNAAMYHNWTGSTIYLSEKDIMEPYFMPGGSNINNLWYTVIDIHGCEADDSITLISDEPVAMFNFAGAPNCSPAEVTFTNNSQNSVSYNWSFGDSNNSTLINPSHSYINNGNSISYFDVELVAYSTYGCTDTSNQYITVWPKPNTTLEADPSSACFPANITFISNPGSSNYEWDMGDGHSFEGGYFTNYTYTENISTITQYNVELMVTTSFGCQDTAFTQVTVYPSPDANFTATPENQQIPNTEVFIDNLTTGTGWEYLWYFGDGLTDNIEEPGSHIYNFPNNYTISLVVKDSYCSDSTVRQVTITPAKPIAKFAPIDPGCTPLTVNFINQSLYADSYFWEFGDGSVSNKPEPTYTYYEPRDYEVRLTVTGRGGQDSYSDTATVYILPNALFDLAPRVVYEHDDPVNFYNNSENVDYLEWDFGDGEYSSEHEPAHIYTQPGHYTITLTVWTVNNCYDVKTLDNAVLVETPGRLEYPDVFSPYADLEENRTFSPGIEVNVEDYHLMIFNRWGELIFESNSIELGWDGYYQGKIAKQDVYIWKVEGKYSNGKTFTKEGDVTLLY